MLSQLLPVQGLGSWAPVVAALCSLAIYGLPAEMLKAVVLRSPEVSAPRLLSVLRPLELLAVPLAAPLIAMGRMVGDSVPKGSSIPPARVTEQEVEFLVAESEQSGILDHEQSEMIRNVLEFRDLKAGDAMVPRTRVMAFDVDTPTDEIIRIATENGHSRYPVYRDRIDNVVGVLHIKDLLTRLHTSTEPVPVTTVMRKPVVFVPETYPASDALTNMRAGRHHMAVVIDEHGSFAGIVTLEDLVEEIVGEIRDEHDTDVPPNVRLSNGRLLVDASISIGDLERYLGTDLPEDGDYHSLGGFVVGTLGARPKARRSLRGAGPRVLGPGRRRPARVQGRNRPNAALAPRRHARQDRQRRVVHQRRPSSERSMAATAGPNSALLPPPKISRWGWSATELRCCPERR